MVATTDLIIFPVSAVSHWAVTFKAFEAVVSTVAVARKKNLLSVKQLERLNAHKMD